MSDNNELKPTEISNGINKQGKHNNKTDIPSKAGLLERFFFIIRL